MRLPGADEIRKRPAQSFITKQGIYLIVTKAILFDMITSPLIVMGKCKPDIRGSYNI